MVICSRHWDRLRQLVCERGLGHLIHEPHDEFEEFAAELCGRRSPLFAFDPMTAARELAIGFAAEIQSANRDGCAVCELIGVPDGPRLHLGIASEAYWPAVIVSYVVSQAIERGLTPRAA